MSSEVLLPPTGTPDRPAELTSIDPWDGSPVTTVPYATSEDVADTVRRAREAVPAWSRDPTKRREVIARLGELLKRHRQELATLISRETGKVLWESLLEADAMANKCLLSIRAEDERRTPASKPGPAGTTLATTYRPHGVAVVLGPFNFPGHLPLGHIAPALLAGNTVVFKPSEKAPGVALLLTNLLLQAGLPDDVLSLAHGRADVAADLLEADIDAVMFTGSFEVGTKILERFVRRPGVMLALELGGNNPLVVWDAADVDAAVVTVLQSAYATAGQRCSCARRLIVPRGRKSDRLIKRLAWAVERLTVGKWSDDPAPFCGTLVSTDAAERVLRAQEELVRTHGADAEWLASCRGSPRSRALITPGLVVNSAPVFDLADEEIFGPLLQVLPAENFDHAIELANATRYGLCAGLITDKPDLWDRFRHEARAGVLTLNRPTTGASSELPFGGLGQSGNHRPSAYFAADYASYPVAEMTAAKCALPDKLPPGIHL